MVDIKLIYYENGCFIDVLNEHSFRYYLSHESLSLGSYNLFISKLAERLVNDFNFNINNVSFDQLYQRCYDGIMLNGYNNIYPINNKIPNTE